MSTRILSVLALLASLSGLALYSAPAAACTDTSEWDCFHLSPTTWTTSINGVQFTGSMTVTSLLLPPTVCDVVAEVDGHIISGNLYMAVTDFYTTNPPYCTLVMFGNFDWVGALSGAGGSPTSDTDTTPFQITISTPTVVTPPCSGNILATIANDGSGGSTLTVNQALSGGCFINGTLSAPVAFH